MNIMKKLGVAILSIGMVLPMSTNANATVNTNFDLTPEQQKAVDFFTKTSLEIIDYSEIFLEANKGGEEMKSFSSLTQGKHSCLYNVFTERYEHYQRKKATAYVLANTPQKINQDISILSPELVAVLSKVIDTAVDDGLSGKETPVETLIGNEKIENLYSLTELMENDSYAGLQDLIGLDSENEPALFFLWGMGECSIKFSEL